MYTLWVVLIININSFVFFFFLWHMWFWFHWTSIFLLCLAFLLSQGGSNLVLVESEADTQGWNAKMEVFGVNSKVVYTFHTVVYTDIQEIYGDIQRVYKMYKSNKNGPKSPLISSSVFCYYWATSLHNLEIIFIVFRIGTVGWTKTPKK